MWHRRLWLIDHGAALYFHHAWQRGDAHAQTPFALIKDHVLLPFATELAAADASMAAALTPRVIADVVALIPDEWLEDDPLFADPAAQRDAYRAYLCQRLQPPRAFFEEAVRARAQHL